MHSLIIPRVSTNSAESVDLFLKEMNQDPHSLATYDNTDSLASPVKPLQFAKDSSSNQQDKDFSSGSDTYTSDPEQNHKMHHDSSLDRNFGLEDSDVLHKTIQNQDDDGFVFAQQTPMNSTTDLKNSPGKSALKKTPNASPKKNVVFTSSIPQVHHYPAAETENKQQPEKPLPPIQHQWNQVDKHTSDDDENPPPPPPPHATSMKKLISDERQDVDKATLQSFQLDNQSMSLNEKLGFYLAKKNDNDDLDQHLQQLSEASKLQVQSHIQNISSELREPGAHIENPLNSLSKSAEVELSSAGSSQSSLQSLVESNRVLPSDLPYSVGSKGIEMKDGIKGFSNELVEQLIPSENQQNDSFSSDDNTRTMPAKPIDKRISIASDDDEFHDSFDNAYSNTEQSIMNLLASASRTELSETLANEAEKNPIVKEEPQEYQYIEEPSIKRSESMEEQLIKEELQSGSQNTLAFEESKTIKRLELSADDINTEDASIVNTSNFTLRDHVDNDWKLEDSNDGDKEDNDATNNDVTMVSNIGSNKELLPLNFSPDSSQEIAQNPTIPSLAPPRVDIAIDATNPPTPVRRAKEERNKSRLADEQELEKSQAVGAMKAPEEANVVVATEVAKAIEAEDPTAQDAEPAIKEEDTSVLANSSNIGPPGELTLPPVDITETSFDELNKTLNASNNTFEESLSAEFDHVAPKLPSDFLSIWHSQNQKKKNHPQPRAIQVANVSVYDPSSNPSEIPSNLKAKTFKKVHLMSRNVVGPEYEELNISNFLPELSEDSGLENYFNKIVKVDHSGSYSVAEKRRSATPLSTKNVLSNVDNLPDNYVPEPEEFTSSLKPPPHGYNAAIAHAAVTKPSKFRVPSIHIRKSNAISSPRNMYNDIFDDSTVGRSATIKSNGMKTLPSMDRDDVQKILNAKRIISQEEYSNIKLVARKSSVVHEPAVKYESKAQQASLHETSLDSSPLSNGEALPHIANQLKMKPTALADYDQTFRDDDAASTGSKGLKLVNFFPNGPLDTMQTFPEPDPDLINSPHKNENIFRTPPEVDNDLAETDDLDEETKLKLKFLTQKAERPATPKKSGPLGKPGSPIKIRSPKKKSRSSISTEISQLDGTKSTFAEDDFSTNDRLFTGHEINNNKIRQQRTLRPEEPEPEEPKEHKISVVSVPSMSTNKSSRKQINSNGSSHTFIQHGHNVSENDWKDHSVQPSVIRENGNEEQLPQERGRLFFRVVGFKNIDLPELHEHQGEFSMTLDNGVHCIKTPTYKLDFHRVVIGKEFELTVGQSLEFILTMKMNYKKPEEKLVEVKERKVVKSRNRLSRIFGGKDIITTTKIVPQEVEDSWENKFAQDGSFSRCYVDFEQFEDKVTGKLNSFDIPCYNEWETLKTSKGTVKCKPYVIGKLEVKMLFVPRSHIGESLPTSIKSANTILQHMMEELNYNLAGYLNQEGGDCEVRKRRYFKLQGTSMIAHSEYSHKTRAKINLAKVIDVIYVDKENPSTTSKYRNFSDVLLVPEAFKLMFANGEVIDFFAANKSEKAQWIGVIEKIVLHNKYRRLPWVKLMLQQIEPKTNNPFYNPATGIYQ